VDEVADAVGGHAGGALLVVWSHGDVDEKKTQGVEAASQEGRTRLQMRTSKSGWGRVDEKEAGPGLKNSTHFSEIHRNSTDSVRPEFKNR
jgi:hypothetical protein